MTIDKQFVAFEILLYASSLLCMARSIARVILWKRQGELECDAESHRCMASATLPRWCQSPSQCAVRRDRKFLDPPVKRLHPVQPTVGRVVCTVLGLRACGHLDQILSAVW